MSQTLVFLHPSIYTDDLTVQELRGPRDQKETQVKPHSISMEPDPWQVVVSNVAPASKQDPSSTRQEQKRNINRWSRPTRERLWKQFCKEIKLEKQQRLYRELRLAEKELNDVTELVGGADPEQYVEQTRELEQTLDAMEELW